MRMVASKLASIFFRCSEIWNQDAYCDFTDDEEFIHRQSLMCKIYDALVDDYRGCNALGNNLSYSIEDVKEFLERGPKSDCFERDVRDYLLRLYLVVERVYEALQVIGLKEERYRLSTDGMRALREVKQWANFFKHPGAFLWCHDPKYFCHSIPSDQTLIAAHQAIAEGFIIDQKVVNDYYVTSEKKQAELHQKLSNSREVAVIFPDLIDLTKRFCTGLDDFCETISSPFFRDTLRKKSTIDDYFTTVYSDYNWESDSEDSDCGEEDSSDGYWQSLDEDESDEDALAESARIDYLL